jgi:hypothetical protein
MEALIKVKNIRKVYQMGEERIIIGKRVGTNIYYSICDERIRRLIKAVISEYFSDEDKLTKSIQ